ncbi:MAG: hypothetical protein HZB70_01300 [Candidatus Berkelbacteria bacterium]|nr:MAG: hypothetical protein HZB70_01300 [Candidatus Berkelbacteria bacterium]QQG52024.1 MAG: hypothetical protein HY845_01695 [Candidatus Berkelbacteria bacterium]
MCSDPDWCSLFNPDLNSCCFARLRGEATTDELRPQPSSQNDTRGPIERYIAERAEREQGNDRWQV